MKIAIACMKLLFGGAETFMKRLARALIERGHEVAVLETYEGGTTAQEFRDSGVPVIGIYERQWTSRRNHVRRVAAYLSQFDAVLINHSRVTQAGLGLLAKHAVAVPIVHLDLPEMYQAATGSRGEWDALVCVSPRVAEGVVSATGISPGHVSVIPHGIEVDAEWPRQDRPPGDTWKLACVGRLYHLHKGVLYLPGIFEGIGQIRRNVSLDIIGDGVDRQSLKELFAKRCPWLKVRWHGEIVHEQVLKKLRDVDILLMPSNFEGFGLSALEAMAAGGVPVASDLKGVTDSFITHGIDGFRAEVGNEAAFADSCLSLIQNPIAWSRISEQAWRNVSEKHRLEQMAAQYESLLMNLKHVRKLGSRPRSSSIDYTVLDPLATWPRIAARIALKGRKVANRLYARSHLQTKILV